MDRFRTVIACGVLVALPVTGSPSGAGEKPTLPDQVYFRAGDGLYRFDHTSALDAEDRSVVSSAGCDELRVRQAVFADGSIAQGFAFSAVPSAAEMVYLGTTAADVRRATGRDITRVPMWAHVVTQRLCRSASGVVVEQDTPADRVTYSFPWEAAVLDASTPPEGVSIEIDVNGRTETVSAARVIELSRKLASGGDLAGEPVGHEFLELGLRLNDPATYGRTLYGLLWAAEAIDARYQGPVESLPQSGSCGWTCFQCSVLSVGLITGGTAALVAGCGASVATLGASCIAAGVGYMSAVMALMNKCLDCCSCYGKCGGTGGGKDGGGKGGGCPEGYHECCDAYHCCSDVLPPACCNPPCN